MSRVLGLAARAAVLAIGLFICFAIAGTLVKLPASTAADADNAAAALLVVCILTAVVWAYLIRRSRWAGWRLVLTVFLVHYGVTTFMAQIESAVFITTLPPGALPRLFLMGAVVAALFAPLAVVIFGKLKRPVTDASAVDQPVMSATDWAWRLGVIIVAYIILYFTFGYFIAWRVPDVRTYYHGVDAGGFLPHMTTVVRETPWLIPFQMVRALLWTALAIPVIRMIKGSRLEAAVAVAVLFSVVMNAQLLLPNAYMSDTVRMAHLVETASSNFLFGALVGWLLRVR
jgi:hypothetical protein